MYIKLIQPKMKKRPMDTDIKIRMAPPLGLLTIASILRTEHRVTIENENIQPIVYDDHPDIVGITVTVDALPHAIEIAKKFRHKGTLVVAGGIHITTAVQTIPDHCFDVLCVGPAEGSWPDIIRDFKSGCLKDIYRCSESIQGDELISPAYDMLKSEEYLYCNVVHTSRGCPYKCDFCYNSSINRSYLNRTIDDVMKDIENVNSKHIMFVDDNFIGNISWTLQLLERLKPLHIKWNAAVSLNVTEIPGLLDQMKESGCQSLFLGFESIRPSAVSDVHKIQNDPAKYDIAVKEIHDRGIMINASFVFGLDGDTKETFQHTLDWIVKNRIETVTSHILTPYPGTVLFDKLEKDGRILTSDLSLYNTAHVVFSPLEMTERELYDGYLWIYQEIYSTKNILRRIPKSKNQIVPYLLFNLLYRKFGRFTDFICKRITYKRIGLLGEKISRYL